MFALYSFHFLFLSFYSYFFYENSLTVTNKFRLNGFERNAFAEKPQKSN